MVVSWAADCTDRITRIQKNPEPRTWNLAEPREPCRTEPCGTRGTLRNPAEPLPETPRRHAAGRGRCRPSITSTRRTSAARWRRCSAGCGSAPGAPSRSIGRAGSSCASSSAKASSSPARVRTRQRVLQRVPSSRHEALHRGRGHVRRQHPVSLSRLDVRPRRTPRGRAAHGRGPALPEGRLPAAPRPLRRVGRAHLREPVAGAAAARRAARGSPGKFRPWRMEDLRLGHRSSTTCRRTGSC